MAEIFMIKKYDEIEKIETGQGDDYTTTQQRVC